MKKKKKNMLTRARRRKDKKKGNPAYIQNGRFRGKAWTALHDNVLIWFLENSENPKVVERVESVLAQRYPDCAKKEE